MQVKQILSLDYADVYQVGKTYRVYSPIALVASFTDRARAERYARETNNEWADEWSSSRRRVA